MSPRRTSSGSFATRSARHRTATCSAAGWSERALHDAILTASLFNLMNRLLDGHGAKGNEEIFATRGFALAKDGYTPLLKLLE